MSKKKSPETVEQRVEKLESLVGVLYDAVKMLTSDCRCTVKERMSGHLVECPTPHLQELIEEYEKTARA